MSSRPAPLIPPRLRALLVRVPLLVPLVRFIRKSSSKDRNLLIALSVVTLVIGVLDAEVSAYWFSPSLLILITLIGGLQLRLRSLAILLCSVVVSLAYVWSVRGPANVGAGLLITMGFTAVLAWLMARTRGKLGVQGLRGDAMLLELRDRLKRQSELPSLPKDWDGKVVLKQAGGRPSAGTSWSPCVTAIVSSWRSSTSRARVWTRAPARSCSPAPSAACSARSTTSWAPATATCTGSSGTRGSSPPSISVWICRPGRTRSPRPVIRRW